MVKIMAEACANRTHQRQDHYRTTGFEVQDTNALNWLYIGLLAYEQNHLPQIIRDSGFENYFTSSYNDNESGVYKGQKKQKAGIHPGF